MSLDYALNREMEAAKNLREQLATLGQDDPDLIRDMIEGETNLDELIVRLNAATGEDEVLAEATKAYADELAERAKRIKTRVETRRTLMATALQIAERARIDTPSGSVSLTTVRPKVIVIAESEIPTRFWKAQDPKLDTKALGDALKAGEEIPGASLTNGGFTVTIRRK